MTARSDLPSSFTPGSPPVLPGGDKRYLQSQLDQIAASLNAVVLLTPQPATVAPKGPVDGMVRLSRSPWRPVSGTTTDAWVYWDAPSSSWLLLHAN